VGTIDWVGTLRKYKKGHLAESWEFMERALHIVHLRKGVHWQDIPPPTDASSPQMMSYFNFKRLYGPDEISANRARSTRRKMLFRT